MKQLYQILALIVIFVAFLSSCAPYQEAKQAKEPYKVGAILPLTGWGAVWGMPEQKGIQMAIEDVNASGNQIKVIIEDSKTSAKDAATAAKKLIEVDKVDSLIVEFSGPTSAVSPMSVQAKIPMIYDAVLKKLLLENPYSIKTYFDLEKQCYIATKHFAGIGKKRVGGLILNIDFSAAALG